MKKLIAIGTVILLTAALFAGCTAPPPAVTSDITPVPTQQGTDAPAESADPGDAKLAVSDGGIFKLPIVETPLTYSIWCPASYIGVVGMKTANDSLAYQEVERRTGIHVDWIHPEGGQEQESFNLVIASQSYPDSILSYSHYYVGGLESYVSDGIILDLTELVSDYAPNYQAIRTADDDIRRRTITDSGSIDAFFRIKQTFQPSWYGVVTRADWMEKLGIESPRTYDQFTDMLRKYKEDIHCEIPLSLEASGLSSFFMAGFDVGADFIVVDGKVKYGPIEEGFREYLGLVRQWFSEGLIDPDFFVRQGYIGDKYPLVSTGMIGSFPAVYTFMDLAVQHSNTDGYRLTAVEPPVKNIGDVRKIMISSEYHRLEGYLSVITTACADPVPLTKWYDYFYTEEGSLFANFGIEGLSYTFVGGKPTLTDLVAKDPNGVAQAYVWQKYTCLSMTGLYDWERELSPALSEDALAAGEIWDRNWSDSITMPGVSIRSSESQEYSMIITDVNAYVREMVVKFIIGTEPLNAFDAYVEKCKNLGIDRAVAIQQAAYNRFMAR